MRLIDADELKKKFAYITHIRFTADMGQCGFEMFSEKEIEDIIDNATTIPQPDFKEGYKQAIIDGKTNFSRPQGDLISRSEAEKLGATCLARRNENGQLEAIISLDNAPTVDLWQLRQEATEKAEVLYGRPQGKWIEKQITPASCSYVCSECGVKEVILSNFCRECGADMRKPNCVTCDHFGKCEKCEKEDEE